MNRWIVLVFLLVVSACSQRTVDHPPLDKEKMIAVLIDVHLLEAQQQQQAMTFEKGRVYNTIVGHEKIFLKHKVTAEEFYDSYTYYRNHPKEMDELYQEVIDEVTRRESEISSEAAKERMNQNSKRDSVKPDPQLQEP